MLWKMKALVDDIGGPQFLHGELQKMTEEPISYSAVRNWGSRGSAPSDWLALILVIAKDRIPGFDVFRYIAWI